MTDLEIEDRVRTTLRAVAVATPLDSVAATAVAHRARRWPAAVAAALVVAGGIGLVAVLDAPDQQVHVTAPPAETTSSPLPASFDQHTAAPFFTAGGTVDDVVEAYLASRFPDYPNPGVGHDPAKVAGELAAARWHSDITRGDVRLRRIGARWAVVASSTDDVFLDRLVNDGQRVHGTVTTSDINAIRAEVIPGSGPTTPHDAPIDIDQATVDAPAVVRISLIGGSVLSISEVELPPPARDTTVIATSAGSAPVWELVASNEPQRHVVHLRAPGLQGTFGMSVDGAFKGLDAATAPMTELGPCCTLPDDVVVIGTLHPDVTAMRVVLPGATYTVAAVADPFDGSRYAVVLVPKSTITAGPAATVAHVQVHYAGGWHDLDLPMDLAVTGG